MWRFASEKKIQMGDIWNIFAVLLGILAPQLNAQSSSVSYFTAASSFVSNVLPSVSASDLSSIIQNVTASTTDGVSTTGILRSSTIGKSYDIT